MATTPLRSARSLVGPARGSWTPEEVARYELAMYRGLASDKKAQRVFLQKVRIVESVRASKQQKMVPQVAGSTEARPATSIGAGGRFSGLSGRPLAAATEPRARRRKSEAQQVKSVKKLQHKWLRRRCEAAAAKAGGSSPKVLARVLACCGRFMELLHPEGAERMSRLRQAEAARKYDGGLNAMRAALAATEELSSPMAIAPASPSRAVRAPSPLIEPGKPLIEPGKHRGHGARKGGIASGSAATRAVSPGAGGEEWPKVGQTASIRALSYERPPPSRSQLRGGFSDS